ncbi:MAG: 1-deoxy-D-xylulose-5-phosphate synthase [bacterium]|nr:1-deoxy-D-xylulose-5-phosphate synthase [bacterium]
MSKQLSEIQSPQDIKSFTLPELEALTQQLREKIISTVAVTGGHLASSLGTVELIVALHYVFNAPKDQIIWDVGHQAYAHKLLTGRYAQFHTLRHYGGLCGFPYRDESEFDVFTTGHASTSISAALGIACARDAMQENYAVIAVIGDGGMTGGMAFEALNNAGHLKKNLMVILNDNEMSISPNVGGIAAYLNRIITDHHYNVAQKKVTDFMKKIPTVGDTMVFLKKRLEEFVKGLVSKGVIFEELGFRFVGPVEGNNLPLLLDTFKKIKEFKGPILIHVVTKKGKGYAPAEQNPVIWHGASSFNVDTGEFDEDGYVSYTDVFADAITELAKENEKIVAITAAMASGTGLKKFAQLFPDRFYDVGIAEQHAVTFAAGLALKGLRPVVAIYSTFLQRAFDQLVHDVGIQNLPVIFAIDRAGLVGGDGMTHQGIFDLSYLRMIPNMTVMVPKDEQELRVMLATAIKYTHGPIAIRYPREQVTNITPHSALRNQQSDLIPIGKAEVIRQGNSSLALLAVGTMVYPSLAAAEELEKETGISATVVNMRFVKPIDTDLFRQLAEKTKMLVTIEENVITGGFGSAVAECLKKNKMDGFTLISIGLPDEFPPHGARSLLLQKYGLTTAGIKQKILDCFQKTSPT